MVQVSIVVPVYNVEKYLNRCVESLVNQTLKDIEIILVDDGSPDNCPAMCDEWASKDTRIKVVHKKNGGLSSARNAGLRIANGKYVGFVDSDDDVELNMYKRLYETANKHNVDFIMSDYIRIDSNNNQYLKTLDILSGYYSKEDIQSKLFDCLIMSNTLEYGPLLSVWHCLYKREFLNSNNIEFDEKVKWSEDNIFSAIVGYNANSFYYLKNEGLYHYYQNPGTITTGYRNGAWNIYLKMNEHLHEYFDQYNDYDFSNQLDWHLIFYACNCLGMIASHLDKKEAKKEIDEILSNKRLQEAFSNIKTLNVHIKLRIQLLLMKYKFTNVLISIIRRR